LCLFGDASSDAWSRASSLLGDVLSLLGDALSHVHYVSGPVNDVLSLLARVLSRYDLLHAP
jgi:hypothetical protein